MRKFNNFIKIILVIIILVWTLFPFYWMLITSVKPTADIYNKALNPLSLHGFTTEHFKYLFERTNFLIWYRNSLIVSITATAITLIVSYFAGYSLARLKFRGASFWGLLIFISYLIPPTLLFIPLAKVVISFLHLGNSLYALIVTYPTFLIPFCTWMLMSYFSTIPFELEECALVDGASRLRILFNIIFPLCRPAIVTVILFSFTLSWGEMIYSLIFVSSSIKRTLPVGIRIDLIRGDIFYHGELMAAALLSSIPVILIFSFFTDLYISGLTKGSVKY
jgi:multiple sugar transport system permease protein